MVNGKTRDQIRLNFYPLQQQQFSFNVWRKPYKGEKKEGIYETLYKNSLPVANNPDIRGDYWVSFQENDTFEEFSCKQDYNNFLTLGFLFHALSAKANDILQSAEFIQPENQFRKRLYFVLRSRLEGKETVWLEPYLLRETTQFGFLIDFRFRKNQTIQFSRAIQMLSLSLDKDFRSNRNFYIDKYRKLNEFKAGFYGRIFPIELNGLNVDISNELQLLPCTHLAVKTYVFGGGDDQTDVSQYRGLENHEPLTRVKKSARFVYVFRKHDEVWLNDLANALAGRARDVNFKGIEKFFQLKFSDDRISVPDFSSKSLDHILQKVIEARTTHTDELVIPIVIVEKTDDTTYFDLKYRFLKEGFALQAVTTDLLRRRDGLRWSTSNIALQIFAKLGGQPWKVQPSNENCIVFGIGQAHQVKDGQVTKYFAYSVSTDSSGLYKKIATLGKSVGEHDYFKQLRSNIIEDVQGYIDQGYQKYVLHVPFKIRLKELNVIGDAVKEIAQAQSGKNLDFVVLKVNTENKFFGYAGTNSLVPYESTCVKISEKEYLIWFEGLQLHRESIFKRTPGPVHVEFFWTNRSLAPKDQEGYLQDLLNLSGANWRGFNAKSLPVSIYYCELVSDFLSRFPSEIDDVESVHYTWFL